MILYTPWVGHKFYNPILGAVHLASVGTEFPPALPFVSIARWWIAGERVVDRPVARDVGDGIIRVVWSFSRAEGGVALPGFIIAPISEITCDKGSLWWLDCHEGLVMYRAVPDTQVYEWEKETYYYWDGFEWSISNNPHTKG